MSYPFAAVLFDMDGVVIDDEPLHHQVWKEFAAGKGLHLTEEQTLFTHGVRAAEVIARFFPGTSPDQQAALLRDREALYEGHLRTDELVPVPGVKEFLLALKSAGVPRVLGTSGLPTAAQIILTRLGIADLFDGRITGADVTHGKPAPEVWQKAAARVGADVRRSLVIEDAFSGIAAAKAAGAACLGITTSFDAKTLLEHGADWAAKDFTSLPAHVVPVAK
jgi:HAD superfamily hydrolase (TIGR01509 family)